MQMRCSVGEVVGVILAGGRGTRLYPVTADGTPKSLVPLFGDETLLSMTRTRLQATTDRQLLVTHRFTTGQFGAHAPDLDQLIEPARRDTGPAIAHAVSTLYAQDPNSAVVISPADHIADEAFTDAIAAAVVAATNRNAVVLIGVRPARASTGYGYITPAHSAGDGITPVSSFHEKPDRATAQALIDQGALWNTGVLVAPVDILHAAIQDSDLAGFSATVRSDPSAAYDAAPSISFDHAVLERYSALWVLPTTATWDDVGSWDAFARAPAADLLDTPGAPDHTIGDGVTVISDGPAVSTIGVDNLVIIAWGDEVLVIDPDASQAVRDLADH